MAGPHLPVYKKKKKRKQRLREEQGLPEKLPAQSGRVRLAQSGKKDPRSLGLSQVIF